MRRTRDRPLIADELANALGPPIALCVGLFLWILIFWAVSALWSYLDAVLVL
jgi:heme O synthase-like polyprenyltransferase